MECNRENFSLPNLVDALQPAVRKLDVARYDRAVITFLVKKKEIKTTMRLGVPVFYDKQTGNPAFVHNTHAFHALCGGPIGNVKVALRDFLGKHPTFDEEKVVFSNAFYLPPAIILEIAKILVCGWTNPSNYKDDDAGVIATSIRIHRENFARTVMKELDRARPNQRVEEVLVLSDMEASGAGSAAQTDDVNKHSYNAPSLDTTVLVNFWASPDSKNNAEYESTIERFFTHPHIEAVYAKMIAFERDEQVTELAFMCDACAQGFQPFGYVYVAQNILFGHLLKIGFTMRTPALRLRELSGAGAPEPFELVAYVQSPNPFALEQSIHAHFADVRKYGRRKEFFTLTREAAIAYFKTLGGHDASEQPPPAAPSKKRRAP